MPKQEHNALLSAELLDRSPDRPHSFVGFYGAIGHRGSIVVDGGASKKWLGCLFEALRAFSSASIEILDSIQCVILRDSHEPGRKARLAAKAVGVIEERHEDLLRDVFGLAGILKDTQAEAVDAMLVLLNQRSERSAITARHLSTERDVEFFGGGGCIRDGANRRGQVGPVRIGHTYGEHHLSRQHLMGGSSAPDFLCKKP